MSLIERELGEVIQKNLAIVLYPTKTTTLTRISS